MDVMCFIFQFLSHGELFAKQLECSHLSQGYYKTVAVYLLTVGCASLSWELMEKRMVALKDKMTRTQSVAAICPAPRDREAELLSVKG